MQMDEIGKGIAQRRKQLGLSQEELAGRIGVTRQAVSKWESGAALPSVDNMVELSKILNASVDELLQLDGETRESGLSAESVGRLLDEQSARQEKRIRRLTRALIIAAAVLAIGVMLSTVLGILRTNRMEESLNLRIESTRAQLNSAISSISSTVANSVSAAIDEGKSLLTDGGCRGETYVHAEQAIQMKLFAYPQLLGGQSEAEFYALLRDGSRISVPATSVNGGFEATLSVPVADKDYVSLDIYVSWQENGETVTEKILSRDLYADEFRMRIHDMDMNMHYAEGSKTCVMPFVTIVMPDFRTSAYPVHIRYDVLVRGETAASAEEELFCDPGTFSITAMYEDEIRLDGQIPFEEITLRATVTDASGNVFTKEYVPSPYEYAAYYR